MRTARDLTEQLISDLSFAVSFAKIGKSAVPGWLEADRRLRSHYQIKFGEFGSSVDGEVCLLAGATARMVSFHGRMAESLRRGVCAGVD